MKTYRMTAIVVGILFIMATAGTLIATALEGPVVTASNYLAMVPANENRLIIATLFLLAAAVSVVLIPAMLFPILRQHHEGIALGYLGFRIVEAMTLFVDGISLLLLITLSREYVNAGSPAASYFQNFGALLLGAHGWASLLNPIVFGTGGLMFYALLYRTSLIPRWLSIWGLLGVVLVAAAGLSGLFGNFLIALALPIALQEMVMAVWLIVKGFSPSAFTSEAAITRSYAIQMSTSR